LGRPEEHGPLHTVSAESKFFYSGQLPYVASNVVLLQEYNISDLEID
jgi:hypothetical protein